MVKLNDVHAANKELVNTRDLVCVSAGGTSGIGETTLRQLAILHGSEPQARSLRVYILARRPDVANALVQDLKISSPKAVFIIVQVHDLSLLKEVDKACDDIMQQETDKVGAKARIDLVLLTQGRFQPFEGRTETSEGLEQKMCLHFYSRMRIIYRLLPQLTNRDPSVDPPAQVVSVYAAGHESQGKMFTDDLSLRHNYSFSNSRTTVVHMETMFFEHLAADHAGKLSLVHEFPGLVIVDTMRKEVANPVYPLWFRLAMRSMLPVAKLTIAMPVPESGQRTLFLASSRFTAQVIATDTPSSATTSTGLQIATSTNGRLGGGAYSVGQNGETNDVSNAYTKLRAQGFYDQVWSHMMDVFNTIEAGKVFSR